MASSFKYDSWDSKYRSKAFRSGKNTRKKAFRAHLEGVFAIRSSLYFHLRLGISSAWTCVVGAEMIAATSGIGYMIHYARELAQPARVYAGVFCIGFVGILIDKGLLALQKRLLSWSYTE